MRKDKLLMTPGPTMIPHKVRETMARQIIHHRTKEFERYFVKMNEGLKKVFQTQNPVLTLVSSGTGGMEAAVANAFSPGDKVLVVSTGVFGDRFVKITTRFGLDVKVINVPWGCGADPEEIKKFLDSPEGDGVKGVFVTHNETSTGVANDIKGIGEVLKGRDCLYIVDAISSLGGMEVKTDEWGIDMVIAGSQKALMLPPGLAFVSVSEKAWKAIEKSKLPKFYFDFLAYRKSLNDNTTPYTTAVSLVIAASEALDMILEEGLENIFARHRNLAEACRAAVKALGLELFADERYASDLITSIKAPEGIDIDQVRKIMNLQYDIMVTGGQQHLKGKIMRIGHMGYVDGFDLLKTITALELSLLKVGYKLELGTGVTAALKTLKM
ncbi:pyridoxal-phosphate-dependent aminotransferase family protein [Caldicoprobacter faecalis]|uniref:L-aspartate aminotransferase apoenzyme /phosphoserine aminotransferase apoenzyme n=1 Tax=Caldicoprobacter faecalis TaxID=937334 RepID=A0A1I5RJS4_9FIRM|nr:alanine--glyoxylate aminotransferase family protein [Caldicoprobacter faecalis]SFP58795.1 L-aspartate aminotransferase apoenzyme /phosphoserine aminotransferase apoenzyme [Caldicoprobacter faecalis]